jgi:hypothetical protein
MRTELQKEFSEHDEMHASGADSFGQSASFLSIPLHDKLSWCQNTKLRVDQSKLCKLAEKSSTI